MQIRISRTVTAAALASLVAATMFGYSRGLAAQQDQPAPRPTDQVFKDLLQQQQKKQGMVVSGEDLGFRLDPAQRGGAAQVGQLVVRVNGQWVEAQFAARVQVAH
jgi:hypothetical protein